MSTTYNLRPGLAKLSEHKDVKPSTLFRLLQNSCPSLTKSKVSRLCLGYAWAQWPEVLAIAKVLDADPYELSGASRPAANIPSPLSGTPRAPNKAPEGLSKSALSNQAIGANGGMEKEPLTEEKSFALPPASVPSQTTLSADAYRLLLGKELVYARQVLITPKLPAACWAAWRSYEKMLLVQIASIHG
jgi:hypothetical protein